MPVEKQHILLACSRLDVPGGIERAVVNNANLFSSKGHRVTILILDNFSNSFYPIKPKVDIQQLPLLFGITEKGNIISRKLAFFKDLNTLKKRLAAIQPHIIIGTEYSLTIPLYLAGRKLNAKLFAWEHHHFHWLQKNGFWNRLFRFVYPRLDKVVCNNKKEAELYATIGSDTVVIPYMVPPRTGVLAPLDQQTILSIGWVIKRKGVDLIPAVAKKLAPNFPGWRWKIIGKGEEAAALQQSLVEQGLENFVHVVAPASHNLEKEYQNASVFAMTSRFECLPMVLLEGITQGLPVVAFDCPTGPADIVITGESGFLSPLEDTDSMASHLATLMRDASLRKKMGEAAAESSKRYTPDSVYQLWERIF